MRGVSWSLLLVRALACRAWEVETPLCTLGETSPDLPANVVSGLSRISNWNLSVGDCRRLGIIEKRRYLRGMSSVRMVSESLIVASDIPHNDTELDKDEQSQCRQ